MTEFGSEIDRIRRAKDITLAAFGTAVQRSEGSVSRILRGNYGKITGDGRRRPPVPPLGAELEMWFDVLGVTDDKASLLSGLETNDLRFSLDVATRLLRRAG